MRLNLTLMGARATMRWIYKYILVSAKQYVAYPKCLKHSISDILFFL